MGGKHKSMLVDTKTKRGLRREVEGENRCGREELVIFTYLQSLIKRQE